jgi:SWI/SNF-related matrix-associated actin-dependent regulator of chromatin subfamily A-like protein 1
MLVLCPTGLRDTWKQELHKWLPQLVLNDGVKIVKDGKATFNMSQKSSVYILTYGLVASLVSSGKLSPNMFKIVCADESHMLKTATAARTIAVLPLLQQATRAICLSGTPVLSRPAEVFTTLSGW